MGEIRLEVRRPTEAYPRRRAVRRTADRPNQDDRRDRGGAPLPSALRGYQGRVATERGAHGCARSNSQALIFRSSSVRSSSGIESIARIFPSESRKNAERMPLGSSTM